MKKLTLLTTTALVAGYMSFATPASAADQGWFASMTQSVQTWFAGEPETSAEVETYLDEVTIAVPPMTGAEAAAIQPAAGDYVEDEVVIETPAYNTTPAPGSMQYQDETSFNTEIDGTQDATVAFGDTPSADDLANIMPAAGDAEEMNDDAIVVVEAEAEAETEADVEMSDKNNDDIASSETGILADVAETTNDAMDATANMANDAAESMGDAMDTTVDTTTDMANDAVDAIDATIVTPAEQVIEDYTAEKDSEMEINVDVNENVTTGTNAGDVGADASVNNNVELDATN
jgi:hypothetical protein